MEHSEEIIMLLKEMGIPASLTGYEYIMTAIEFAMAGRLYGKITTKLYPHIAEKYNTTSVRVERSIRHAIEVAWSRGNINKLQEIFGYTVSIEKGKPTNMEFIAQVADYLNLMQRRKAKRNKAEIEYLYA